MQGSTAECCRTVAFMFLAEGEGREGPREAAGDGPVALPAARRRGHCRFPRVVGARPTGGWGTLVNTGDRFGKQPGRPLPGRTDGRGAPLGRTGGGAQGGSELTQSSGRPCAGLLEGGCQRGPEPLQWMVQNGAAGLAYSGRGGGGWSAGRLAANDARCLGTVEIQAVQLCRGDFPRGGPPQRPVGQLGPWVCSHR